MKGIKGFFGRLVKDESGGEVLEYALILGLIVVATVESSRLGTTTCFPSGVTRASHGCFPVRARPTICPVLQSIATSVPEPEAAT